jgi:hypothetical protein
MRNVPWASDAGSLSDADFSAFLGACRHELAAKQAVFQQRVQGGARWFYDMADLSLTRLQTPMTSSFWPFTRWMQFLNQLLQGFPPLF